MVGRPLEFLTTFQNIPNQGRLGAHFHMDDYSALPVSSITADEMHLTVSAFLINHSLSGRFLTITKNIVVDDTVPMEFAVSWLLQEHQSRFQLVCRTSGTYDFVV